MTLHNTAGGSLVDKNYFGERGEAREFVKLLSKMSGGI
jgi:hypothetical protein